MTIMCAVCAGALFHLFGEIAMLPRSTVRNIFISSIQDKQR